MTYRLVKKQKKSKYIILWLSDQEYKFLYELGQAYDLPATTIAYKRALGYDIKRNDKNE